MKRIFIGLIAWSLFNVVFIQAQPETRSIPMTGNRDLVPVNVKVSEEAYSGRPSLKVIDEGKNTEARFVKIRDLTFNNGSLEIDLAGKPAEGASEGARGFVGIAFRINDENSKFECFYIRPTNGRADDQVRRNHSAQYSSYPDFPWFRLRKEFPEKYESYVDLVAGAWTKIKIVVQGERAELYVHGASQPTLIVNDLKHGPESPGTVGLWIGPGTEAHFSDLKITTAK